MFSLVLLSFPKRVRSYSFGTKKLFFSEALYKKVPRLRQNLVPPLSIRNHPGHGQHPHHAWKQQLKLRHLFFSRTTGREWQKPLTIRFQRRLDPPPHAYRFPRQFGRKGGEHATGSERTRVVRAEIAFDDGPQTLTFGRGLCNFQHASSHLVECPCHRFDEQVVLALKMPVEAPFRQAYLLHHRPDAAAVTAVLAERASCHGKNVLVVPRFVFQ